MKKFTFWSLYLGPALLLLALIVVALVDVYHYSCMNAYACSLGEALLGLAFVVLFVVSWGIYIVETVCLYRSRSEKFQAYISSASGMKYQSVKDMTITLTLLYPFIAMGSAMLYAVLRRLR